MARTHRLVMALVLAAPLYARAGDVPLETDDQKALYTAGAQVANNLKSNLEFLELSKDELATFLAGINDEFTAKPRIDEKDEAQAKRLETFRRNRMQALLEKETGEAKKFIEKAAKEKGAVTTKTGLIYRETNPGKGNPPKETDVVKVQYHGTLRDGSVFDSSRERGEPAEFPLNGVIPCWTEALQKMKPGGKAKLVCPADIAYGSTGAPPKIRPGAALAFEVELLSVSDKPAESRVNPHGPMGGAGGPPPTAPAPK